MKKTTFVLISIFLLILSTIAFAQSSGRYYVQTNNGLARALVAVRHNFDNGFTADLTGGQLMALEILSSKLGFDIEEVDLYYVTKPSGGCEPWPACRDGGSNNDTSRQFFPLDQTPWGIETVYNDPSINSTTGGLGVDVALLDTGVFKGHLDLKSNVKQCVDFTSKGKQSIKLGLCDDNNGHGTHVAGTILANGGSDGNGIFGVAPQASLLAYKVCGSSGSCWADDIAKAIEYAADNGAEIISMSLGGDTPNSLINNAINYAYSKDVLIIAASGNDGPEDGSIDYPAANALVVAVGAIGINENNNDTNKETVPSWSSRGINDGDYIIEEKEIEFGAPGVSVESTWNDGGYNTISGTSMATPHVSGLAAKFWQGSATTTRVFLHNLAKDIWAAGDDTATGFGLPVVP